MKYYTYLSIEDSARINKIRNFTMPESNLPNENIASSEKLIVDAHFHVGLLGDQYPNWGKMSKWYQEQIVYKSFLIFVRVKENEVSDQLLREETIKTIKSSNNIQKVVCLALDPVYDKNGTRREDLSNVWIDNDYIIDLRNQLPEKVLLGASVHPYDPEFKSRVDKYVAQGATLIKWLPSAQQINLADKQVREALLYLATAKNGKPLPLLLHVGGEYAIPSSDPRTSSYDFLCWTFWDKLHNLFKGKKKPYRPQIKGIHENLKAGLDGGATIIFAHCGLPYFAPNIFKRIFEHSDFQEVTNYLKEYQTKSSDRGKCYADVSALVTPFRKSYFKKVKDLPQTSLLFGSDFPTPVFELSADLKENWKDFKAILKGHFDRIVVPQDNLLDVNFRELSKSFPGHPMFINFNSLL